MWPMARAASSGCAGRMCAPATGAAPTRRPQPSATAGSARATSACARTDGYITLEGRRSELIISGGFNIYPREIEELLLEQPGIREATVVGATRSVARRSARGLPGRGRRHSTRVALEAHLRTQLASFKIPRAFVRVDALAADRARQGAEAPAATGAAEMSPALLSLVALLLVIAGSLTSRINVGILAVALAWPIAVFAAGWKVDAVMATFPSSLFLTLLGVSVLFGVAQANGTMQAIAQSTVESAARARRRSAAAVLSCWRVHSRQPARAPSRPRRCWRRSRWASRCRRAMPVLLTALMVGNGANAGNLSPISAVGVIVHSAMAKIGLEGHVWNVWAANFTAHALAALLAWALFGGPALLARGMRQSVSRRAPLTSRHWTTIGVIAVWVVAVVRVQGESGALRVRRRQRADSRRAWRRRGHPASEVPWAVILMVCGVSVLIGVLEKTGGMDLFTTLLARDRHTDRP